MFTFVAAQLRHRPARTLGLLLGILVATTSFTVLTGTTETSRLRTVGTVEANFRSAYDILVRPGGSTTELERGEGLVRQNFLSGIYGGITQAQWEAVKALPGVEVAAPIAMVGYVAPSVTVPVDLTDDLTGTPQELLRVRQTWVTDHGASRAADADSYVYVTDRPLVAPSGDEPTRERVGGQERPVCRHRTQPVSGPFDPALRAGLRCWSRVNGPDGLGRDFPLLPAGRVGLRAPWPFPLLVAGIDPDQEARLAGLDRAVVAGRYLRADDATRPTVLGSGTAASTVPAVPVLTPTSPYLDQSLELTVEALPAAAAGSALDRPLSAPASPELAAVGGRTVRRLTIPVTQAYRQLLSQLRGEDKTFFDAVDAYWTTGPTRYERGAGGALRAVPTTNPGSVWASAYFALGYTRAPKSAQDVAFRRLTGRTGLPAADGTFPVLRSVGEFDPAKLPGFSALSAVPLETYNPPQATPDDDASRATLGGRDLRPDGNPAGYLQSPPLLLTTLAGTRTFTSPRTYVGADPTAPLSVIRVRVAGVTGADPLSQERVRSVAQRITGLTGLDVDITVGSSPAPTRVTVPAGRFGRPELTLREGWVKKGVAVAVLAAVDRKSLLLLVLILAVCALFVFNASVAAVRTRRTELGVLASLGWTGRHRAAAVLAEVAVIGLVAGMLGAALALPLARLAGLHASPGRAALAVPSAVLLSLVAGALPARRAARMGPLAAIQPAVVAPRGRGRSPRGVTRLALANTVRMPGRALVAVVSLAVGVAAATALLAVTVAFRGVLVGSLLGEAVTVEVRGADYVAAGTTVLLGVLAVTDVLFLNLRERAGELATLRTLGWREGHLARLVTVEGLALGLVGSGIGVVAGLAAVRAYAGSLPAGLTGPVAAVLVAGTALGGLAALGPAMALRRLPTTQVLAED